MRALELPYVKVSLTRCPRSQTFYPLAVAAGLSRARLSTPRLPTRNTSFFSPFTRPLTHIPVFPKNARRLARVNRLARISTVTFSAPYATRSQQTMHSCRADDKTAKSRWQRHPFARKQRAQRARCRFHQNHASRQIEKELLRQPAQGFVS